MNITVEYFWVTRRRTDPPLLANCVEEQWMSSGEAVEEQWRSSGGAVEEQWRSSGGAVEAQPSSGLLYPKTTTYLILLQANPHFH